MGLFSFLNPITGGRVGDIVSQEMHCCTKADGGHDKFTKFCETYKSYIDVTDAYGMFAGQWEVEKKAAVARNWDASASDEKGTKGTKGPSLLRALLKSFYGDLLKAFFSKLVWSVLVIFSIWYFVFEILAFINRRSKGQPSSQPNYEFYLCGGFFLCMFVLSVGIQQMGIFSSVLGSKVKAALTTAIYKKMISRDAFGSKANVVALVAKDVEKLAEACLSLQYLWSGILETVAVLCVVLSLLGRTILPGVGLMLIFLPLQYWLGVVVAYRKKSLSLISILQAQNNLSSFCLMGSTESRLQCLV